MPITEQTTFGVEAEFYRLPMITADPLRSWLNCDPHDDGSLRDTTYLAGTLPVYPQVDENDRPILSVGMKPIAKRAGLEIVTKPYQYDEIKQKMRKFAYQFASIPPSPRASIHIHVDADGITFAELKSLLIWTRALEAVIFRLSCGGLTHRGQLVYQGEYNDHKYARPLSDSIGCEYTVNGGLSNNKFTHLIDWKMLEESTRASELAAAWGRLDLYWRGGFEHYWPHRLHAVNISSILRQGTIEWRIFDGLYAHMEQFVELVYKIHKLSERNEPDFKFTLGDTPNIDADWVSKLLDMDVSQLWGVNWPVPIRTHHLRSHYANAPTLMSLKDRDVSLISNGITYDDGKPSFKIFRRR